MKTIKSIILFLITATLAVADVKVKLVWDAPDEGSPPVTGYSLYKKSEVGGVVNWSHIRTYPVGERVMDITADGSGTYAITATNNGQESEFSNEVVIPGKPDAPLNVRVIIEVTQ